jgi:hypothetical protein
MVREKERLEEILRRKRKVEKKREKILNFRGNVLFKPILDFIFKSF